MYRKFRKYKKHRNSSPKKMTEFEKFQWIVFIIICAVLFCFYLIKGFIFNCIFEWPIRWDIGTCWHEQIAPAQQKAVEGAAPFSPL